MHIRALIKRNNLLAFTVGILIFIILIPGCFSLTSNVSQNRFQIDKPVTIATGNTLPNSTSPLGIGLNGIADWSTELPFLDAFKSSRKWIPQCVSGDPDCNDTVDTHEYNLLNLDQNGWVKSLPTPEEPPKYTRVSTLLLREIPNFYPSGQYIVLYEGEGKIEYTFDAKKDETASRPGRDVINVDAKGGGGILLTITSTDPKKTGNYIRNIRVVKSEYENNFEKEIFNPVFLYIIKFAQTVKERLDPNLKVYVEFSNEVWNWSFQQSQYALQQGKARWGQDKGDAFFQWYGMRAAQTCDIWKSVFGNQKNRVACVMGTQTGWKGLENNALECPYWVAEGNKPCYQHGIDVYAITGYFSGGLGVPENSSTVESWLNEPDGGFGKALKQLKEGGLLGNFKDSLPDAYNDFQYHSDIAKKKGLKLVTYEGGQHITGAGGVENNEKLTKFFI